MKNYMMLFILLIIYSCYPKKTNLISTTHYDQQGIAYTNLDDEEMVKTIDSAKQTFKIFESFFNDSISYNYSIKVGIPYENGKEQLWLNEIIKKENKYYGRIYNQPLFLKNVKYKDFIEIPFELISDWMILKQDSLIAGGFTWRLLRNRMPAEDRKIFDQETQIKY